MISKRFIDIAATALTLLLLCGCWHYAYLMGYRSGYSDAAKDAIQVVREEIKAIKMNAHKEDNNDEQK